MTQNREMTETEFEALLRRAVQTSAQASIRAVGSPRMLGNLQVRGREPGKAVHLTGAKHRDQIILPGSDVVLSILLGDEIITAETVLLDSIISNVGDTVFPPILRAAWPPKKLEIHRRGDVRVAGPDLPPLKAVLFQKGRRIEAHLLNLTETGMGLALPAPLELELGADVEVEAHLPNGELIRATAEVRHAESIDDDDVPMRVGLVLGSMSDEVRETLRSFIQARRTGLSDDFRKSQ